MKTLKTTQSKKPSGGNSGFQRTPPVHRVTSVDMQIDQIIKALKDIADQAIDPDTFIYDFLRAFNVSKSTITRAKEGGDRNITGLEGALLLTDKILFSPVVPDLAGSKTLEEALEEFRANKIVAKKKPRFYVVTDYTRLLAFDSMEATYADIAIEDLAGEYMFFLPLAGMSATKIHEEAEADTRAADRMAKLYDQIVADNPPANDNDRHALNLFLTRLLFCYFAEDTSIFGKRQFTDSVETYTKVDGSDVSEHVGRIFETLSLAPSKRKGLPPHLAEFRYVNGGLFNDQLGKRSPVPNFNTKSRTTLIALGNQTWAEINPDIFGSMFQGVIDEEKRGSLGMHYTSVPNIMKVIEPLFLNDLRNQFQKAKGSVTRLNKLLYRIYHIRIFDPACGSGNFLIIAYKELRKLEMDIFHELDRVENRHSAVSPFAESQANFEESGFRGENEQPPLAIAQSNLRLPGIHVSQFYGIEIDDFASEVAVLALWLAEHQMNVVFQASFGHAPAPLPLKDGAKITRGNATRLTWTDVCPLDKNCEIFILGNPPYEGSKKQNAIQKADVKHCLSKLGKHKDLDYIACWFVKASDYIRLSEASYAFVTTNSLNQGVQVEMLWPYIFSLGQEIFFAWKNFKWKNNAKNNAGVTCSIIGVRKKCRSHKMLFTNTAAEQVNQIGPYLIKNTRAIVGRRTKPLTVSLPRMNMGNQKFDGGHLVLNKREKQTLLDNSPSVSEFIRPLIGTKEFIDGTQNYCLWIPDHEIERAQRNPDIANAINKVREYRLNSGDAGTRKMARIPHKFRDTNEATVRSLLVSRTSSENRPCIPAGFYGPEVIIADAQVIYDAPLWVFAVVTSRLHYVWSKTIAGGLETRIRYSSAICYNNFPFPQIDDAQKRGLETLAEAILSVREEHPEKTIAQLYDPKKKMPEALQAAHAALDLAVERCYRKTPFSLDSDDERLEFLFKLYEKMSVGVSSDTDENLEMELEDA
jgi:hypothetical protein